MKRLFDIVASLLALVLLAPFMMIVALSIKLTSPGSVLYIGVRTGLHNIPFRIYKFRTMVENAEMLGGPTTAHHDKRLTPLGYFLRKFKIDELPQLLNILKGEMSIVGPRPQVEQYTKLYQGEEKEILTVRPGLTDYASIQFVNLDQVVGDEAVDERYMREIEPQKNRLRLKYVKEQSFAMDIKIIFLTFLRMVGVRAEYTPKKSGHAEF